MLVSLTVCLEIDMQGAQADPSICGQLLQDCTKLKMLEEGKRIHGNIIGKQSMYLSNILINMYIKCGSRLDAQIIFNRMPARNVVSWNILISGYAQQGYANEALDIFMQMEHDFIKQTKVTMVSVLSACTNIRFLEQGKRLHAIILKEKHDSDVVIGCTLVDMYSKCGRIFDSCIVFERLPNPDVFIWTAIIAGYAQNGKGKKALELCREMREDGIKPNKATFVSILAACATIQSMEHGKMVHSDIEKNGFQVDVFIGSSLVDMYSKCGNIENARLVFGTMLVRNIVAWNAMIAGYIQHRSGKEAFKLFTEMLEEEIKPDNATFSSMLAACTDESALARGRYLHAHSLLSRYKQNVFVGSALIDMYMRCQSINGAFHQFSTMAMHNVATWNTMIMGFARQGDGMEALRLFKEMCLEGEEPDNFTYICILTAVSSTGALETGKWIHSKVIVQGWHSHVSVSNTLVDMYAKCGNVQEARKVHEASSVRDVVSWNAIISAYAWHGDAKTVMNLFHRMQEESERPTGITFLSVLTVCSHAWFVDECHFYFCSMYLDHNIMQKEEHYACIADTLARAGRLDEAETVITMMPINATTDMWMSIIGSYMFCGAVV